MPSIYARDLPAPLGVCQTQACLNAASSIQNFVNFSANPCDDFFQFACGTFVDNAVIPDSQASIGTNSIMTDRVAQEIQELLTGSYEDLLKTNIAPDFVQGANYSSDADKQLFGLLKTYFGTCMDTDAIDSAGPIPLYPVLGGIDIEARDYTDAVDARTALMIQADAFGAPALWSTIVAPYSTRPGENSIWLGPLEYTYAKTLDPKNDTSVAALEKRLVNVTTAVLSSDNTARAQAAHNATLELWERDQVAARIEKVVQFQRVMRQLASMVSDLNQVSIDYVTIADLQTNYPFVNWEAYFRYFTPEDVSVPADVLVMLPPTYLETIDTLFKSTSIETFRDYLLVELIMSQLDDLDSASYEAYMGVKKDYSRRAVTCTNNIRKYFDVPLGRYYVMKYFGGAEQRNKLYDLVTHIHTVWADRLKRADWLDAETLANAETKIDKIGQWVGFYLSNPDDRAPASLLEYLGPIEFGESYLLNQLIANRYAATKKKYRDIGKPINREKFDNVGESGTLDVNAFYFSTTNYMAILPTIAQDPLYSVDYPAYLNYGGLGFIIGHEFTHGFDSIGRNYDGDGIERNWWTNTTTAIFEDKSQCFIRQYSNFTVEGPNNEDIPVNAELTLGENIADNGGVNAAYEAFVTYWDSGAEEKLTLPGISLTPEQLFFVNYARFYCTKFTPEANSRLITEDNHSPDIVRAIAPLQNSNDFARAYNCPVGSYMNPDPKEKCSVW